MAIGKIYFALVDAGVPFNDTIHNVEDEKVLNLQIEQSEGNFASAEIEIKNPGIGLLNPSRKKRAFISYDSGSGIVLLFSGRVIGFPTDLATETVRLNYIAQPEDWEATQISFLNGLKVSPYYNELFIPEDRRDNASDILEARSSLLYWDRATNTLSLSDILEGSNLIDLGDKVLFDTVRWEIGDPPVKSVNLNIEVQWEQFGVGEVDVGLAIKSEFTNSAIGTAQINSLTPLSFEDAWKGVRIPNGYDILESKITPVANGFGLIQSNLRSPIIDVNASDFPTAVGGTAGTREVSVPRVWYKGDLKLQAVYEQKRREILTTTIIADTQDFSLRGDKTEDISIRLQDPTAAAQGEIFNAKLPSFFYDGISDFSTIGVEVIENSILRAMARLKYANRVIETRIEGDLDDLINITVDHSLRFVDDRLPGGSIRGKVSGYILEVDGDSGQITAQVTLQSCIGIGENSSGAGTEIGLIQYNNEFGSDTPISLSNYSFQNSFSILPETNNLASDISFDGNYIYNVTSNGVFIHQLVAPFDLSIAPTQIDFLAIATNHDDSLFLRPDGTMLFIINATTGNIKQYNLSTPFSGPISDSGNSFTVGFEISNPSSMAFSQDGLTMVLGNNIGDLAGYTLGIAWDITSTVANGEVATIGLDVSNMRGITFSFDGNSIYTIDLAENIKRFDLLSAHSITGISYSGDSLTILENSQSVRFDPSMQWMLVGNDQSDTIELYFAPALPSSTVDSSIFYQLTSPPIIDEPIDVVQMESNDQYLIDGVVVSGDGESQVNGFQNENVTSPEFGAGRPDLFLQNNPTEIVVDLKSMNPNSELFKQIDATTSNLTLPKHVDMEA